MCCTLLIVGCGKDPIDPTDVTFKDTRDQHVYKYVKIGTQAWMAENLAYLPAVSPSSEGSDTLPFYYVYDYEGSSVAAAKVAAKYDTYGVLYNWEAAKIVCPSGWHLPTDAEWTTLEDNLGALPGKKMKSTTEWDGNGNGDNSSGFNALPGGYRRYGGGFSYFRNGTSFWSASEDAASTAWERDLGYDNDVVGRHYNYRSTGCSVRCLQN